MSRTALDFVGDRWRWPVLVLFCLFSCSNAIQWISFASIAGNAKVFFGLSTNELNMLSSVYMIVFAAGAYFTCTTFERWGVRLGVLIGSSLNALGSVLKVAPGLQYPSYTTMIIPQTLNAVAQLFVLSTPPLIAAQYFAPQQRAFATAIASTANSLGNAIALFAPPLIVRTGVLSEFMLLFCLEMGFCVLILVGVIFFLRPPSYQAPSEALLARDDTPGGLAGAGRSVREGERASVSQQLFGNPSFPSAAGEPTARRDDFAAKMTVPSVDPETTLQEEDQATEGKMRRRSLWRRVQGNAHVITFLEVGHTIWLLSRRRDFVFLMFAFSISMGSVWTFSSVLAQILEPFGVSDTLAGVAGALNVVVGTAMAYVVGIFIDRKRLYKYPVLACLVGSVVCCIALMVVMLKAPPNTRTMNGLTTFVYVFAGLFQNTAIPICFEFAMEISYPLPESVPGALLMAGANIISLIMLSVASVMLGDGVPTEAASVNVIIMITCVCALGALLAVFPREHLRRHEAEVAAYEQRAALLDDQASMAAAQAVGTSVPAAAAACEEDVNMTESAGFAKLSAPCGEEPELGPRTYSSMMRHEQEDHVFT